MARPTLPPNPPRPTISGPPRRRRGRSPTAPPAWIALLLLFCWTPHLSGQETAPPTLSLVPVHYELDIGLDYEEGKVRGTARITVRNASDRGTGELPLVVHRLMSVSQARDAGGEPLSFTQDVVRVEGRPRQQVTAATVRLPGELAPGEESVVEVDWSGFLTPYTEIGWLYVRDRVDRDFTILRPDAFAYPEIDLPSTRTVGPVRLPDFTYRASVTVPADLSVANGGRLVRRTPDGDRTTWVYESLEPSWRMDFAIADYGVLEEDGIRVFYLPGDSAGAADVLAGAERALEAFTDWFGPLRGAPRFSVIEIPDGFGSQADATAILQSGAAFGDPDRLHEVYHEISHLWHLRGGADDPRWSEGLATYLELHLAEELDGLALLDDRIPAWEAYWKKQMVAGELDLESVPMIDFGREGLTGRSYTVGMFMFHALHQLVGDEAFGRIVGGFYRAHPDGRADTDDFVAHADRVTDLDLGPFFDHWLYTTRWATELKEGGTVDRFVETYPGGR